MYTISLQLKNNGQPRVHFIFNLWLNMLHQLYKLIKWPPVIIIVHDIWLNKGNNYMLHKHELSLLDASLVYSFISSLIGGISLFCQSWPRIKSECFNRSLFTDNIVLYPVPYGCC